MPDAVELVKTIKKTAIDAQESTKPVNVCFGKVMTVNPLTINVEQKMILGAAQLVLSRNVTDYMTEATVQWESESTLINHRHAISLTDSGGDKISGNTEYQTVPHTHDIEGRKNFLLHNGLEVGEEVILLRMQGGQKYLVWDRIG